MLCSQKILEQLSQPFKGLFHFFIVVICVGCRYFILFVTFCGCSSDVRTANNIDRQSVVNLFTTDSPYDIQSVTYLGEFATFFF